jgi:hypothetical protein
MAADLNLLEKPKAGILAVFFCNGGVNFDNKIFSLVFKIGNNLCPRRANSG